MPWRLTPLFMLKIVRGEFFFLFFWFIQYYFISLQRIRCILYLCLSVFIGKNGKRYASSCGVKPRKFQPSKQDDMIGFSRV